MTTATTRFAIVTIGAAMAAGWSLPASATTLVTSLAAFRAAATGTVTATPNPGNYDLSGLFLPTTTSIALGDGTTLGLSTPAQVTTGQNGYPYAFADGFSGEIFTPQDSNGNQVSRVTISLGAISALGFEVAPFSAAVGQPNFGIPSGPYTITVAFSNGQSQMASLAGGSFNTGTTASQFFGFVGGGVSSLTISTSDPNGLGFGNFVDVPEPVSATVLLVGLAGLVGQRRAKRA